MRFFASDCYRDWMKQVSTDTSQTSRSLCDILTINLKFSYMFKPMSIRVASVVSIILSIIGLLLSFLLFKYSRFAAAMGVCSWGILIWASIIGYKLSKYKLYEEEYKKVGLRVYAIIICFMIFLFFEVIVGFIISVLILSTLWALKSNYDDWEPTEQLEIKDQEQC